MRVLHDISGWLGVHAVAINICASKTCWKSFATAMRATPTDSNTLLLWLWAVNRMYRLRGRAQRAQAMSTPINWPRNSRQWKCVRSNNGFSQLRAQLPAFLLVLSPNKNISHSKILECIFTNKIPENLNCNHCCDHMPNHRPNPLHWNSLPPTPALYPVHF